MRTSSLSKLILFDFQCEECDNKFEELVNASFYYCRCPLCSGLAKRLPSAGHINYRAMGVDSDFPTAGEKWNRMQEQKARLEKKGVGSP
jgi:putative FmdB family regulatory protein